MPQGKNSATVARHNHKTFRLIVRNAGGTIILDLTEQEVRALNQDTYKALTAEPKDLIG